VLGTRVFFFHLFILFLTSLKRKNQTLIISDIKIYAPFSLPKPDTDIYWWLDWKGKGVQLFQSIRIIRQDSPVTREGSRMSRFTKNLLIMLCISNALLAVDDTQKTTHILRDHRHRAAVFTTFHELKPSKKDNFGSKVQITGFYHETQSANKLGEIFGANGTNKVVVGTPSQVTLGVADVENNFLLHYHNTPNTLKSTIKFEPKHDAYGTIIEANIKLDRILKGLYFKQNSVMMTVENKLNVSYCDEATGATSTEAHKLADILSGNNLKRELGGGANDRYSEQAALKYAKISCGGETRTGVENIESTLGWHFLDKDDYYVGINIVLQSPSGDRPRAEYLWEPRLGNQHWGLGCGLDAGATLWENNKQSFKLKFEFHYRYLFDETEYRTLGIKNVLTDSKYCKHVFSHYYLLGEIGKYTLYPAANILTKRVDVEPGSQIDTFIDLNFNWSGFVFDLGYNLFWKERESVSLASCDWQNGKYAIAAFDWQTCNSAFAAAQAQPANTTIEYANIDTSVAETPSIFSNSIFGSVGYIFKNWKNPMMFGAGGAYEWGDDRSSADSYSLWLKGGISF
jgi:hypothetical protein